jgi:hypothetical protein
MKPALNAVTDISASLLSHLLPGNTCFYVSGGRGAAPNPRIELMRKFIRYTVLR